MGPNAFGEIGTYQICRKCPSLEDDCETSDECQCDHIEIEKKGKRGKPSKFVGGSNCQTLDRKKKNWCYVSESSKCDDKKISKSANNKVKVKDVFQKNKIFFSNDACNNVNSSYFDIENGNPLPTGNEKFLYGYKILSDDLQYKNESSGEFIKLWFDMDSPEDCQYDCEERRGVCGAWSYDFSTQTCYLHNVDACCGQLGKREENQDFVSGYTCTSCWTTKSDCTDFCPLSSRQYDGQTAFGAGGSRPKHFTATGGLAVRKINNPNADNPCKCRWVRRIIRGRPRGFRCKKPLFLTFIHFLSLQARQKVIQNSL